ITSRRSRVLLELMEPLQMPKFYSHSDNSINFTQDSSKEEQLQALEMENADDFNVVEDIAEFVQSLL
ncbi:hypothetical protein BDQ17DRAFT_1207266, partial [Cyathus striatus]